MALFISSRIRAKLAQADHNVTEAEILECFANRQLGYCVDNRPEHQTIPPTQWFAAETDHGRWLKIVFVFEQSTGIIEIKSAYSATDEVQRIYKKYAAAL